MRGYSPNEDYVVLPIPLETCLSIYKLPRKFIKVDFETKEFL